jgi:hypothetical protein
MLLALLAATVSFTDPSTTTMLLPESGGDARALEAAYGVSERWGFDRAPITMMRSPSERPNPWHFDFMLYGIFGNLVGDVGVRGHEVSEDIGAQQILSNLQFTMAGRARVSYERWFAALDVFYVGLAGSSSKPPSDLDFDQWIVQPTIGYGLCEYFDVFAGARYNRLDVDATFHGPLGLQRSGTQDWWDPIVGGIVKGRIGEHFAWAFYADIGGFGVNSDLTAKLEPMISWYFSQHASFDLAYQAYYVNYDNPSDGFDYDMWMYGPLLGVSVHF